MLDVLDKFSTHGQRALRDAVRISAGLGSVTVNPEHVLYGIAKQRGSIGAELLTRVGAGDLATILRGHKPAVPPPPSFQLAETTRRVIARAAWLAYHFGHRYVGTEHLLAGLLESADDRVERVLRESGLSPRQLNERLHLVFKSTSKFPELADAFDAAPPRPEEGPAGMPRGGKASASMLDAYATELTSPAAQRRLDPLVGREAEVERVIHVLCRRTKNNPLLLGDPGVGKTAIVEGLAQKIAAGKVPDPLRAAKIYQLDLGLLVAGSSYRGEFEQRLKHVMADLRQRPDVVLFIDEIHTLVGAGSAAGAMDAANLMKPSLTRGELRCIGATTLEDYKRHLETDAALERRFQPIIVHQPGVTETMAILRGLKPHYERYHGVAIAEEAITAAATLADRYIHNKFLPDKAIDLLDEAAARRKLMRASDPMLNRLRALEHQVEELESAKRAAVRAERFAEALNSRHQIAEIKAALAKLSIRRDQRPAGVKGTVSAADVHHVMSKITGMDPAWLKNGERLELQRLERTVRTRVLGQAGAVRAVVETIRRAKAGIANARRPLGSFLFLGPSGVGKTELARVLSEVLFPHQPAFIRLDMSEFSESFTVSRLIGSPAGYVGYREGTQLTDQVRKHPHSVVLLDEIEKAHPQVLTLLLQMLDDGGLTDATGKTTSFRHAIVIMTSNVGTEQFRDHVPYGFAPGGTRDATRRRELERDVVDKLPEQFPLEFINRIDQIAVFKPLTVATVADIAGLQLGELRDRLAEHHVKLSWSRAVAAAIARQSFSPDQGARAVRRTIQQDIEGPIAGRLLRRRRPAALTLAVVKGRVVVR